jgi:hypothetical protein
MQQQMMGLEVAGKEAEVAQEQAAAEKAAIEMASAAQGGPDAQQSVEHESKLIQSGEMFVQKMAQSEVAFREKMRQQQIMSSIINSNRIKQKDMSDRRKRSGMGSKSR